MKLIKVLAVGLSLLTTQVFAAGAFDVAQDAKRLQFASQSLANTLGSSYRYQYLASKARYLAYKASKVKRAARRGAPRYVVRNQFRQTLSAFFRLKRSLRYSSAMSRPYIRFKTRRVGRNMRNLRSSVRFYSGYGRYYRRYSRIDDSWIGVNLRGGSLYFKF